MEIGLNGDVHTLHLKQKLDLIDDIRNQMMSINKEDTSFHETLLSCLPQFVVCGPQSSGKSSVIRRISSISLPEAATLCTRIATQIQIRRSDILNIQVSLIGPNNTVIFNENNIENTECVTHFIEKYQNHVVALNPAKAFIEDHIVNIEVYGPNKPNVTLVDLPGFTNKTNEDSSSVNSIVQRYITMEGTLVLHVVRGDQDYDTCIGNDFMRTLTRDKVTVLTHCDKLDVKKRSLELFLRSDTAERIRNTMTETSKNGCNTFAILGNIKSNEENFIENERKTLSYLTKISDKIQIGIDNLVSFIERKISEHIQIQLPKAYKLIKNTQEQILKRLSHISEKNPIQVLVEIIENAKALYYCHKVNMLDKIRPTIEELCYSILDFPLYSSSFDPNNKLIYNNDEVHLEQLQIGNTIYVPKNKNYEKARVIDIQTLIKQDGQFKNLEKKVIWKVLETQSMGESFSYKTTWSPQNEILTDIKVVTVKRQLRNVQFADKLKVLEFFLKKFYKYLKTLIIEATKNIQMKTNEMLKEIVGGLMEKSTEHSVSVIECIDVKTKELSEKNLLKSKTFLKKIKCYLCSNEMIFASNELELSSVTNGFSKLNLQRDEYLEMYLNLISYLRIQKKFMAEFIPKELTRLTVILLEEKFFTFITNEVPTYQNFIVDPPNFLQERQILTKQVEILTLILHKMTTTVSTLTIT